MLCAVRAVCPVRLCMLCVLCVSRHHAQVIGKLAGNSKAGIACLLTLPSKAEFRSTAEQQAAAGISPQSTRGSGGGSKGGKQDRTSGAGGPATAGGSATSAGGAAAAVADTLTFIPSYDLVVAGDSAGGMFVWSPFSSHLGSADREVAPRVSFSGHGGEVWAMCLAPGPEDAQVTAARVFTAGGCGAVPVGVCLCVVCLCM